MEPCRVSKVLKKLQTSLMYDPFVFSLLSYQSDARWVTVTTCAMVRVFLFWLACGFNHLCLVNGDVTHGDADGKREEGRETTCDLTVSLI